MEGSEGRGVGGREPGVPTWAWWDDNMYIELLGLGSGLDLVRLRVRFRFRLL